MITKAALLGRLFRLRLSDFGETTRIYERRIGQNQRQRRFTYGHCLQLEVEYQRIALDPQIIDVHRAINHKNLMFEITRRIGE